MPNTPKRGTNMQAKKASNKIKQFVEKSRFEWFISSVTGFKRAKLVFLSTVLFALAAHLFCWMNPLFSHDSLMIVQNDWTHQTAIGRPFQQLYVLCRGAIVAPWLIGMLGTTYMALANCLVAEALNIRSRAFSIGTASLTATSITVTLANATYITWYDIFMLSYLCAALAIFTCVRLKKTGMLLGTVLVCISLGLYQSYVQVYFTLALFVCIRSLIEENTRKSITLLIKETVTGVLGCLLYLISVKSAQLLTNTSMSEEYNSVSTAFSSFKSPLSFVDAFSNTYLEPFCHLLSPITHATTLCSCINLIVMLSIIAALFLLIKIYHLGIGTTVLISLCTALTPLAMGCINLASYGVLHELMFFSYSLIYPFAFMCIDMISQGDLEHNAPPGRLRALPLIKAWKITLAVLIAMTTLSNVIFANQIYLKKELEYEATASLITRIIDRMEQVDGYVPGETPIAFIGTFNSSPTVVRRSGFESVRGVGLYRNTAITYYVTIGFYFKYVMGYPLNLLSEGNVANIADNAKVKSMPVFPQAGSIQLVENVLVVKISNL